MRTSRMHVAPALAFHWALSQGLLILFAAMAFAGEPPAPATPGDLAGSASCRSCHESFYQKWATSRHGTAMQPFTAEFAQAHLSPMSQELVIEGSRFQFDLTAPQPSVRETKGDRQGSYPVEQVLGGKNVYYFLTRLERGRLQTLPIAYDVRRKEWFDTAASGMRHFPGVTNELVRWTEPPYTFNTSCNSCHVSQLSRNYDTATDTYQTSWREPGINCETCHGPAAEHVRLCTAAGKAVPEDLKIIKTSALAREQRDDQCSSCHAKAAPLSDSFPPGADLHDHFAVVTYENPDYYPDGRDLGENYTYTSWRLSPCRASRQLECLHCHTSSGRFRFADNPNAACLPCHESRVKDVVAHAHHARDTEGARCVSCHMPKTEFARMERSDHSMLPPTPAASVRFRSPNACNLCHPDKTAEWADSQVRIWHKDDYQAPVLQRAELVQAARTGDWTRLDAILAYLGRDDRQEVFTASLLRLLAGTPDPRKWPVLRTATRDASPLVRAAATAGLEGNLDAPETQASLSAALRDPRRVVRMAAASALAGFPASNLPAAEQEVLRMALTEYEAMLLSRPDTSSAQYNLGNYHQNRGNVKAALAAYEQSARLDPLNLMPLVNASVLYAQQGDMNRAEEVLRRAVKIEPLNAAAQLNFGLLLAEQQKLTEAKQALRLALKADPALAVAAYNLAVMVAQEAPEEAVRLCQQAVKTNPREPKYGFTLAYYQAQAGDLAGAAKALQANLRSSPAHLDSALLLGRIYETQKLPREAVRVYENFLKQSPPEDLRSALNERIQKLKLQF